MDRARMLDRIETFKRIAPIPARPFYRDRFAEWVELMRLEVLRHFPTEGE